MVTTTTTASRAFGGPFRYIQGPGEFRNLEMYVRDYGNKVFVLIDAFLFDGLEAELREIFADAPSNFAAEKFNGECCESEVARVTELAREAGAEVIAGVGGGKTLDTAKIVANNLGLPQFIIPTSASTDAPTSSMSVLYKDTGEHLRCIVHRRGPDLVLVDSRIIARAPLRLFVAGIGDALSTWFEARANARSDTANYIGRGYRRCKAGMAIAQMCYDVLMEDGFAAKLALEKGALSEAVENVIEANILLSGLGFENTGCAGAHSLHTGFHEIPEANRMLHGEIVAFGVIFQLVMENEDKAELEKIVKFLKSVGLPITLKQLNVEPTPENIRIITGRVVDGNSGVEAEPFLITEELVYNAIVTADAIGEYYLNRD